MTLNEIQSKIEKLAPGTKVEVVDLTGQQREFLAKVVSPLFLEKTTVEQQRIVFDLFRVEVDSEVIHSLSLQTFLPGEWAPSLG